METDNKVNEKAVQEAIDSARQEAEARQSDELTTEEKNENKPEETADQTTEKQTEAKPDYKTEDKMEDKKETEPSEDETAKRKDKHKKHDKKDEKIDELTDKLKRSMAEFDNFRKRTEREKSRMYESGAGDVICKMLPIMDNFERGLASVPEERKAEPFVEGMDKIYKQMTTALEEIGVKPIESVGQEFNPDFHNAVMHVEDEESGDNMIVEEFQKGYTYRETVIRHSMVKVAN